MFCNKCTRRRSCISNRAEWMCVCVWVSAFEASEKRLRAESIVESSIDCLNRVQKLSEHQPFDRASNQTAIGTHSMVGGMMFRFNLVKLKHLALSSRSIQWHYDIRHALKLSVLHRTDLLTLTHSKPLIRSFIVFSILFFFLSSFVKWFCFFVHSTEYDAYLIFSLTEPTINPVAIVITTLLVAVEVQFDIDFILSNRVLTRIRGLCASQVHTKSTKQKL